MVGRGLDLAQLVGELSGIRLYPGQLEMVKDGLEIVDGGGLGVLESPTGTGKTVSALLIGMGYLGEEVDLGGVSVENVQILGELYKTRPKQVIYACRTHEQMDQVVKELAWLNRVVGRKYLGVVLGSRRVTCIHERVRESVDINHACQLVVAQKKCAYYNKWQTHRGGLGERQETISIEAAVKRGRECGECPYYYLRNQVPRSGFVILPYSHILKPDFFAEYRIWASDALVIVDEGHNLYGSVVEENSVEVDLNEIKMALHETKEYLGKEVGKKRVMVLELYILMEKVYQYGLSGDGEIVGINRFIYLCDLAETDLLQIGESIKKYRPGRWIAPLRASDIENRVGVCIDQMGKLAELLGRCDKSSYVMASEERLVLKSVLPGEFLSHLNSAKSVLIIGGTLFPSTDIGKLFKREVVSKSYPAVCQNIVVSLCNDALFTYPRREIEVRKICDLAVEHVQRIDSGGVLVFVQSKDVLGMCKERVGQMKEKMDGGLALDKGIECLFEGDSSLATYRLKIAQQKKALLFCVMGGCFSEGVNFADELCRVLIIGGLPLPKPTAETAYQLKLQGKEFFIDRAMCVVNQTIGRAVRKASDYCYVILLDTRFIKYQSKISQWVQKNLKVTTSSETLTEAATRLKSWQVSTRN
ncbi:chromosome transmission fidelity protein 1 [Nematocida homosporus]|uniref:chromosome transmission fidelity protein 1 n=1 Tax=Nematocida homosporus TaxID=1912981 RepID=UPI00221ED7A6|nr:chromosome transmission fidelity protein 1 [Nematocida homosporus]KAI5184631.1 chromosome transmission fidelity protein 1 [Nematocida homosporus]